MKVPKEKEQGKKTDIQHHNAKHQNNAVRIQLQELI